MNAHDLAADLKERFGLNKRPRSWGGTCPSCSYPRAFSMKIAKGDRLTFYCANGCSREQLDEVAERELGSTWKPSPAPDTGDAATARAGKQAAALRLWSGSTPCQGTPAALYLAARGLARLAASPALRCRPDCWHPEGGRYPALVALIEDAAGRPLAVHRTYLKADGRKAGVDPVKASLGPIWGGAIRLDPIAPELVIGEGIETAASAGRLLSLPSWAAVSAGNLAHGLVLPEQVRAVVVAADADRPGRRAADDAARRWRAEGRRVRIVAPDAPGLDFNDLLLAGAAEVTHA